MAGILSMLGSSVPLDFCDNSTVSGPADAGAQLTPASSAPHTLGDANCDTAVDVKDVKSALTVVAELTAQDNCSTAGDVNCDGQLDVADALGLLRSLAGVPLVAPGCPPIGTGNLISLTVDKFGEGSVGGAVTCGTSCTYAATLFPSGTELSLWAIPNTGSELYPWEGCTTTTDDERYCTVILDQDTTVSATFGSTAPVELKANAKQLDSSTMDLLLREEGDPQGELTLFFAKAASAAAALQSGDVIISTDQSRPLLRTVNSVSVGATEIAVLTGPAGLTDAFASGAMIAQMDNFASPSALSAQGRAISGAIEASPTPSPTPTPNECEGVSNTLFFSPFFTANVCATLKFDFKADFEPFRLSATAKIGLTGTVGLDQAKDFHHQFAEIPFAPQVILVGGVFPVEINPGIAFNAGLKVTGGDGTFSGSIKLGEILTFSLGYNANTGFYFHADHKEISEFAPPSGPLPKDYSVEIDIGPSLTVKLYDLIGPTLGASGVFNLTHATFESPSGSSFDFWEMSISIRLNAGIVIGIGPLSFTWGFNVAEFGPWTIWYSPADAVRRLTFKRTAGGFLGTPIAQPDYGPIESCSSDSDCSPDEIYVPYKKTFKFYAVPDEGFYVYSWGVQCASSYIDTVTILSTNTKRTASACILPMDENTDVNVIFGAGASSLTIDPGDHGSVEGWFHCPGPDPCSYPFLPGHVASLSAVSKPGYVVSGWTGCGVPAQDTPANVCTVTGSGVPQKVSPIYVPLYTLTVNFDLGVRVAFGDGGVNQCVSVRSSPCQAKWLYAEGAQALVTASPQAEYVFLGWSQCDSTAGAAGEVCQVTMDRDHTVSVSSNSGKTLHVDAIHDAFSGGEGYIDSSPPGIVCGDLFKNCDWGFTAGQTVTLTAHTQDPLTRLTWGAGCAPVTGQPEKCTVTMSRAKSVTATFQRRVTLVVHPEDHGTVNSSPGGISGCRSTGGDCTEVYLRNTQVTLSLAADPDYMASGCPTWYKEGVTCFSKLGCSNDVIECTLDVSAAFGLIPNLLTIETTGLGRVTSTPAGINCGYDGTTLGEDCQHRFPTNTNVVFNFHPKSGWEETGIQGCSNPCKISGNQTVTVTFGQLEGNSLQVIASTDNPGFGYYVNSYVTSNDGKIHCLQPNHFPPTCQYEYQTEALVTLTANIGDRDYYVSWDGCEVLTPTTCNLLVSGPHVVTVTFLSKKKLSVDTFDLANVSTVGAGQVTGDQGIDCGLVASHCEAYVVPWPYPIGLTANPINGGTVQWDGCTPDEDLPNTCYVLVNADTSVSATFSVYKLEVYEVHQQGGTTTITSPYSACDNGCIKFYPDGTIVTLLAEPVAGWVLTGWQGCDTVSPDKTECTVAMNGDELVNPIFSQLFNLSVNVLDGGSGLGGGITSDPAGFEDCTVGCTAAFPGDQPVFLSGFGYVWTGCDIVIGGAGEFSQCGVTHMSADRSVTATYSPF